VEVVVEITSVEVVRVRVEVVVVVVDGIV